jgi:UDP-N-acetylmuramate--alanine ligase
MDERNTLRKIHFVGIGGIGMSGLAEVLHRHGFVVTGSDAQANDQTAHLTQLGVKVWIGHDASHVDCDLLVYTPAVDPRNPELRAAEEKKIPSVKRAELLGDMIRGKKTIAISGTHGKTTTTAMIATILDAAQLDPAVFVGGVVQTMQTNARWGGGEWCVVEADEYDRSFHELYPHYAILNNIESDHLDCYSDVQDIYSAFIKFANQASMFGKVFANADDAGVQAILPRLRRRVRSFGIGEHADVHALHVRFEEGGAHFDAVIDGKRYDDFVIACHGEHNVANATAAIAVSWEMGLSIDTLRDGLATFRGTGRRFEILGTAKGVMFVDDYAHHPTEIRVTLAGAKKSYKSRRLIAVFQPHLYSRTRDYMNEFAAAFQDADRVLLTDIYPAREKPIPGVTGEKLYETMVGRGVPVRYIEDKTHLDTALLAEMRDGDLVITLGAGDITQVGRKMIETLKSP